MRRISIDTLGMSSPRSSGAFYPAKRRRAWVYSRPRLLTTVLFFVVLYCWFSLGRHEVVIPEDSFAFVQDERLADILNTTLGFQKILVLNLPFRTDRRDAITLSAATSNIALDFVDGVTGDSIRPSAYPPPEENIKHSAGIRGSWRTHMNALQTVVQQNLTTALILEDDVDWDIRIRQNLQRFAVASRFLSTPPNIHLSTKYKIESLPNPETPETAFHILNENGITSHLPTLPLASIAKKPLLETSQHHISPYGDPNNWDILWIGHCGAGFPRHPSRPSTPSKPPSTTSNIILTHPNDPTVPTGRHLKAHPFQGTLDPLALAYPNHTRVYHRASGGELCTVGYVVSQRGARRLLHQFGIKGWNGIFDSEMGRWCAGEDPDMGAHWRDLSTAGKLKGRERVCLTSQPPLFAHHHPQEGESDIGGLGGGYARGFETKYLRLSVRMNLERLVQGIRDLVDQWPDNGDQVIP